MKPRTTTEAREKQDAVSLRAYFAALPAARRKDLKMIRQAIRDALPGCVDAFSYQIPAVRYDGKVFLWYATWKDHYSVYPIGQATARVAGLDPGDHKISKGTIRFSHSHPPSPAAIKRLARARLAEVRAMGK